MPQSLRATGSPRCARREAGASRARVDPAAARWAGAACTETKRHPHGALGGAGRTVSRPAGRRPAAAHGPRGKTAGRRQRAGADRAGTLRPFPWRHDVFLFGRNTAPAAGRLAQRHGGRSRGRGRETLGGRSRGLRRLVSQRRTQRGPRPFGGAGPLSVGLRPGAALAPEPTFADGFMFGRSWHATFTRDAAGGITGYELTNGRCRCVKFPRQ